MIESNYAQFLARKQPRAQAAGIEPGPMPDHLWDFAAECVRFGLRQGRWACFLDTGMSKTRIQLEWSKQAIAETQSPSLLLTDLGIAWQIAKEGQSLGYDCRVVRSRDQVAAGINICNYDMLDALDASAFGVVSLDESGILKNFSGATTRGLIATFADTPFRMCATATPAPNDHTELGNHAEFLGVMTMSEMLVRWFINDTGDTGNWRLKHHAQDAFWDWMASWSRCAETPADLGFDASHFLLPSLSVKRHKAAGEIAPMAGSLFVGDVSATTMFSVKRQTSQARADMVAQIIAREPDEPWIIWCDTDDEADALIARLPDAADVRGSLVADKKEKLLVDFTEGRALKIITKPRIAGRGMNWQHCARIAYVGRSFSYEAWYQTVRRCWRFGQKRPVEVHLIVAEGEDQIGRVIDRKASDHNKMKRAMAAAMKRAMIPKAAIRVKYYPTHEGSLPAWL